MLVRIANREDPDQTASDPGLHCLSRSCFFRSSLIRVCIVCQGLLGKKQVFEILEHLPFLHYPSPSLLYGSQTQCCVHIVLPWPNDY